MNQLDDRIAHVDPDRLHRRIHEEAGRRGHEKRTAYAGLGGLFGALLGSFFGRAGAGAGGLLGALFGAILGQRRDAERARPALPAPAATTAPVARAPDRDAVTVG